MFGGNKLAYNLSKEPKTMPVLTGSSARMGTRIKAWGLQNWAQEPLRHDRGKEIKEDVWRRKQERQNIGE